MVVKRRSRNTGRTKKILNRSFRRKKRVRNKKYSRKYKRRKTWNQRGGDRLDYFVPQQGWVTGDITYNGNNTITVNGIEIKCASYEEKFDTNGNFHCWSFLQPNGTYIYIRPREPSNMTDLLTEWGC